MFYRNNIFQSYFDTLRLHLRVVRALQRAGGDPKCFIHRACDSLQIGHLQILNQGLHLAFEALQWLKFGEIWGTQNEAKKLPPTERLYFTCGQLQFLTSNYSS